MLQAIKRSIAIFFALLLQHFLFVLATLSSFGSYPSILGGPSPSINGGASPPIYESGSSYLTSFDISYNKK